MGWVTSLRPLTVIKVGILTLLSYKISTGSITLVSLYLAVFITLGASATMVLNDWFDRVHDLKKGKDFAFKQGRSFLFFAMTLWLITLAIGSLICVKYPTYAALSSIILALGLFYFLTRHVVGLSAVSVALAGSLPVLFGYVAAPNSETLFLFFVVFLLMLGRETVKDLQDLHDLGYKKTLPVTFGTNISKVFTTVVFVGIIPLVGLISPWLIFPSTVGIGFAIYYLLKLDNKVVAKKIIDLTSFLVLGFLFVRI